MPLGEQIRVLGVGSSLNKHIQYYTVLHFGNAERTYCFELQTTEIRNSMTDSLAGRETEALTVGWAGPTGRFIMLVQRGLGPEIRIKNLASTGPGKPRQSHREGKGEGEAATPWTFPEHLLHASLNNYSRATVRLRKLRCREVTLPVPSHGKGDKRRPQFRGLGAPRGCGQTLRARVLGARDQHLPLLLS